MPEGAASVPDREYLHGHHESVLRSHRWRTVENSAAYILDALEPGATVLDVGCGPGTITLDIARRVTPGAVVGIDAAPAIVDAAARDARTDGAGNVEFRVADVYALDPAEGTYDVVHAHQVLQHLEDPVRALRAMRGVCRAGGAVAARDADYAAMTWYPDSPGLDRWRELYRAAARDAGGEPDAGRRLLAWAHDAKFSTVTASASSWCFASPDDRHWWSGLWAERVERSTLANRIVQRGLASVADLRELAESWRRWGEERDGWFVVLHGEVRCRP
jgi:SAM-dependent methyltransferase